MLFRRCRCLLSKYRRTWDPLYSGREVEWPQRPRRNTWSAKLRLRLNLCCSWARLAPHNSLTCPSATRWVLQRHLGSVARVTNMNCYIGAIRNKFILLRGSESRSQRWNKANMRFNSAKWQYLTWFLNKLSGISEYIAQLYQIVMQLINKSRDSKIINALED